MDQALLDYVRSLSARDAKSLTQCALKLSEETGELAKVVLPFENAPSTRHRLATKSAVAEEAVDVILVALSLLHKIDYSDEDIDSMMRIKATKWDHILEREGLLQDPDKIPHEIHLTVNLGCYTVEYFKNACAGLSIKPIVLELPIAGGKMDEVMTSSHFFGTTADCLIEANKLSHFLLSSYGLKVIRRKIETVPWHPHAPQVPGDTTHKDCYFECHVGVLMDSQDLQHTDGILHFISPNAHMSRNVFKRYDNGEYVQMMTIRNYGIRQAFDTQVDEYLATLDTWGFKYEKVIREYAIYDTNIHHDQAWIGK